MIREVYLIKVSNEENKAFGFGVTDAEETVYVPGKLIVEFDIQETDVGTKNKMYLTEDKKGCSDFMALTFLEETSAAQNALEFYRGEVERLEGLLDAHGVPNQPVA
jgi:hypothetical protein